MKGKFVHDIESARAEWANQIIGERDRLRAEVEILVWNLAGISTMACRRTPILYNGEMARPALDEVAELVKDYDRLRDVNAELVQALEGSAHPVLVDDACMSFRHDFGLMTPEHQEILRETARFWLEAWGKAILAPSKATKDAMGQANGRDKK